MSTRNTLYGLFLYAVKHKIYFEAFVEIMGHAGAVVLRPDGMFEGAADPRCDGAANGF